MSTQDDATEAWTSQRQAASVLGLSPDRIKRIRRERGWPIRYEVVNGRKLAMLRAADVHALSSERHDRTRASGSSPTLGVPGPAPTASSAGSSVMPTARVTGEQEAALFAYWDQLPPGESPLSGAVRRFELAHRVVEPSYKAWLSSKSLPHPDDVQRLITTARARVDALERAVADITAAAHQQAANLTIRIEALEAGLTWACAECASAFELVSTAAGIHLDAFGAGDNAHADEPGAPDGHDSTHS